MWAWKIIYIFVVQSPVKIYSLNLKKMYIFKISYSDLDKQKLLYTFDQVN